MKRWLLAVAAGLAVLATAALGLDRAFPPPLGRLAAVGREVDDAGGRPLAVFPAQGGVWRFRAAPGDVSPVLIDLLVATEDRRFWHHWGVDPLALARAAAQALRAGRVVSGGSTLSMQAARLLEPRPRTVGAKLIEMARAIQLEAHYGKRGVLGIWLTLAPFGGNLEGVRAASLAWFGTTPAVLEPAQAALLVGIPRRPEALRPDRHPQAAAALRDRILAGGVRAGLFPADPATPVPAARLAMLRHAATALAGLAVPDGARTTLDLDLQRATERLAGEPLAALPPRVSLAMLVADADTGAIRAIFPGPWGDTRRAGALDLTRAVRSPGSALKPFLYAMAFADGLAAPGTWLDDAPRRFGDYAPEDFDRGFSGPVTAGEALRRSLNLPAVALLDRLGPLRFAAALRATGVRLQLPRGADPSLPLALGGEGITLRDAAGLYTALATDGAMRPLHLLPDAPPRRPFLPADAAAQVAAVLTRPFPGGGPEGIAWKTGTSWGARDAWAFGFDARHVAAVWVGRPDGTPMPGGTGVGLATPLLARLFALLPAAPRDMPPPVVADSAGLAARRHADALRLLFPPDGAALSADGPVTLRAMGGRRPLTFLIDGAPLAGTEAFRREAAWSPDGPGFYRITVLDADGAAAHARVQVR